MNVTQMIAHGNQGLLIIIYVNFPKYYPFPLLALFQTFQYPWSFDREVFDEFVEPFHTTNVQLQRRNANQNAAVKNNTFHSYNITGQHIGQSERIFVLIFAFAFVLTFIIATLCLLPVEIKSFLFLCFDFLVSSFFFFCFDD